MMTLKKFLHDVTLQDVFAEQKGVVSFDHDTSVGRVLEILGCYRILSAPVVVRPDSQPPRDPAPDPSQLTPVKAMLGFVGVGDILEQLLKGLEDKGVFQLTPAALEALGADMCDQPVVSLFGPDVAGSSTGVLGWVDACSDWGLKGNIKEPLLSIIRDGFLHAQQVTSPTHRRPVQRVVHRLAVFDCSQQEAEGAYPHLKGVFSQSDVVRLVGCHEPDLLGHLGKRSLQDLGLVQGQVVLEAGRGTTPRGSAAPLSVVYPHGLDSPGGALHRVVCVHQDATTLEAFQVMYRERVSGVGVVARDGRLVGNLSASDLRCLAPGLFSALLLPVANFLAKRPLLESVQQEAAAAFTSNGGSSGLTEQRGAHFPTLITCQAISTFAQVVGLLSRHSLHRIYVVDPDQKPIGVVTLTDVLRTLWEACDEPAVGERLAAWR